MGWGSWHKNGHGAGEVCKRLESLQGRHVTKTDLNKLVADSPKGKWILGAGCTNFWEVEVLFQTCWEQLSSRGFSRDHLQKGVEECSGKQTFHGKQQWCWQCGAEASNAHCHWEVHDSSWVANFTKPFQHLHGKMNTVVRRLKLLGVKSLHESTAKYGVALLLSTLTTLPEYKLIHQMLCEFKQVFHRDLTKVQVPLVRNYPSNPAELVTSAV